MLDHKQNELPDSLLGCNSSGLETANLDLCTGTTTQPTSLATSHDLQQLLWSTLKIPHQDSSAHTIKDGMHTTTVFDNQIPFTWDPNMSFRDRHRLLDGVYNSYRDPSEISAKTLGCIAQAAGLSMEEILCWFEDEKERRTKFLASLETGHQHSEYKSLVSNAASSIPGPGSRELPSSPTPFLKPGNKRSSSTSLQQISPTPIKEEGQDPQETKRKRNIITVKYPCPDCGKSFPVGRWLEHVKRVHFPDHIWECSKINKKVGEICSRLSFRPDNFATHLEGEHDCVEPEISLLKVTCKFKVVDLFHQRCGLCSVTLASRDESLEHIKNHFKEISETRNPPADLGASQWKENCHSDHKIRRGIHYAITPVEDFAPAVFLKEDFVTLDPEAIEDEGTSARFYDDWPFLTAETSYTDMLEVAAHSHLFSAQELGRSEEMLSTETFPRFQSAAFPRSVGSLTINPPSAMETPPSQPRISKYSCHCGYEPQGEERWKASNLRRHKKQYTPIHQNVIIVRSQAASLAFPDPTTCVIIRRKKATFQLYHR